MIILFTMYYKTLLSIQCYHCQVSWSSVTIRTLLEASFLIRDSDGELKVERQDPAI